jgi:hypothetical protein
MAPSSFRNLRKSTGGDDGERFPGLTMKTPGERLEEEER